MNEKTKTIENSVELEAAKKAANEAVDQAKDLAFTSVEKIKGIDHSQKIFLGVLIAFILIALIFDMVSFRVYSDGAVTETQAAAQRSLQARMNSWGYSIFGSSLTGKLAWMSALAGVGILIWSTVTETRQPWIPLSQVGIAGFVTALMLLLWVTGFPDLGGLDATLSSNVRSSATLIGYWIPLALASTATFVSAKRVFG